MTEPDYLGKLREMLADGLSIRKAAQQLKLSHGAVHATIKRHGMGEVGSRRSSGDVCTSYEPGRRRRCKGCGHSILLTHCLICRTRSIR